MAMGWDPDQSRRGDARWVNGSRVVRSREIPLVAQRISMTNIASPDDKRHSLAQRASDRTFRYSDPRYSCEASGLICAFPSSSISKKKSMEQEMFCFEEKQVIARTLCLAHDKDITPTRFCNMSVAWRRCSSNTLFPRCTKYFLFLSYSYVRRMDHSHKQVFQTIPYFKQYHSYIFSSPSHSLQYLLLSIHTHPTNRLLNPSITPSHLPNQTQQ
jgi:hypothetical protein